MENKEIIQSFYPNVKIDWDNENFSVLSVDELMDKAREDELKNFVKWCQENHPTISVVRQYWNEYKQSQPNS